ncbi:MAG: hypothetical protein IJ548_03435 [Paludibacteraceae bacterium]|nr:hypothetical protein [Paludibacteraceae bacterium]MBQ8705337.1 hypothetical protein [Paludibacteraceae bacterium]
MTQHTTPQLIRNTTRPLFVLIACEESQAECTAFRELGHIAFSCDIQPCRPNGNPEWHIMGDVTKLLQGSTQFVTMDGHLHCVPRFDLIVAHPPCTYLCKVSSVHMVKHGVLQLERYTQMMQAREFFMQCLNAKAPYLAVENPLPMARARLPRPSCFIQPSWFGVKYTKKTLYWLRNLPPIMPEIEYPNPKEFARASRGKYKSRTFPQVARALARQWSKYILDDLAK